MKLLIALGVCAVGVALIVPFANEAASSSGALASADTEVAPDTSPTDITDDTTPVVDEDPDDLVDLHARGAIRPLVHEVITLDEVPAALTRLASRGTTGKVVWAR